MHPPRTHSIKKMTGAVLVAGALYWGLTGRPTPPANPQNSKSALLPQVERSTALQVPPETRPRQLAASLHPSAPILADESKKSLAVTKPNVSRPTRPEREEATVSMPALRPIPARPNPAGGNPHPVVLDFSPQARFPAILAAPAERAGPEAMASAPADSSAQLEAGIMEDFIKATADVSTTDTSFQAPLPDQEALQRQDQTWNEAAIQADKQLRALIGDAAFQKRSLDAARLRLHLMTEPTQEN